MNETNHPSSLATCTLIQDLLGVKDGGIYEAVVQLKQQLDAVVAECADMKNAHAAVLEHINVTDKGPAGTAAMIASDALYNTATPNVTAALAEIKAQGADACVRALATSDDDDFTDAPNICAMVAFQLRKGESSNGN